MTSESLESRIARLEAQVRVLRPDIPRFGPADAEQRAAETSSELREEFAGRSSLSTEFLTNSTLDALPTQGVRDGAMAWISDGRKQGEGAGAGTGVLAYFDSASGQWERLSDDTAVAT